MHFSTIAFCKHTVRTAKGNMALLLRQHALLCLATSCSGGDNGFNIQIQMAALRPESNNETTTMIRLKYLLAICFFGTSISFAQNAPALFFSDLTWGPNSGWEGSSTKGAAVTIWGENFGTTRGSSYVTVNGAQVNSSDYAEWDAIGPARGLERITFFLNSSMASGAGTISVTVGGVTSNTLPFNITTGTIYFISLSGNNANNGLYSTQGSGTNGPFHDIYMANPGLDGYHTSAQRNPSGDGQYICYVRAGNYTTLDPKADFHTFLWLGNFYGSSTKQKAVIAYPGETPTLDTSTGYGGVVSIPDETYPGSTCCGTSYFTFSKLTNNGAGVEAGAYDLFAAYNFRIVGASMLNQIPSRQYQAGQTSLMDSQHIAFYGNYSYNSGGDDMMHLLYIKCQNSANFPSGTDLSAEDVDVGWNDFSTPVSTASSPMLFVSRNSGCPAPSKTDNIRIHHNYFHDGTNFLPLWIGDGVPIGNVYVYSNVMARGTTANTGFYIQNGAGNVYAYNNTIFQIANATYPMIVESSPLYITPHPNGQFINNILYLGSNQSAFFSIDCASGDTANFDHNLFYDPKGTVNPPSPIAGCLTVTNNVAGNPNPLFINPASSDFHLQSASPARGAGANLYSTLSALPFGTYDYEGKSLPSSGAWDVGAYEYAAGSTGPDPPTSLAATVH